MIDVDFQVREVRADFEELRCVQGGCQREDVPLDAKDQKDLASLALIVSIFT